MEQRVAIVTGASDGIGRIVAERLAASGHEVHLACRNPEKAGQVQASIRETTGNPAVHWLPVDLGSLDAVRTAAHTFLERERPIHVLVNNAGVGGTAGHTVDGFELAFGVNHLGHFLLTQLLRPRMGTHGPTRIVNVSSNNHFQARGIDLEAAQRPTASVGGLREYAMSKLANVVFTAELTRREPAEALTAVAVHPGRVASQIWRHVPWLVRKVLFLRGMRTPEDGAAPVIDVATRDEVPAGAYFDRHEVREPHPLARDPEAGRALWEASERFVGAHL